MSVPAHIAMHLAGGVVSPFVSAAMRPSSYRANELSRAEIPSLEHMIDLYQRDIVPEASLKLYAGWHGVAWKDTGIRSGLADMWDRVIRAGRDWPTPDELMDWKRRGGIRGEEAFDKYLRGCRRWHPEIVELWKSMQWLPMDVDTIVAKFLRDGDWVEARRLLALLGWRAEEAGTILQVSQPLLPVAELLELWRREPGERAWVMETLGKYGYTHNNQQTFTRLAQPLLTPDDIVSLWLRGEIAPGTEDTLLAQHGYGNIEVQRLKRLSENVPGVADVVRYMIRDVADPLIVNGFGLDAEFTQKVSPGLNQAEIVAYLDDGTPPAAGVSDLLRWMRANGYKSEAALSEWRAHWDIPSLTQLQEMLHRNRPEKYAGLAAGDPNNLTTTVADVELALGQNDVLPYWRKRLISINYAVLGRVDIRRMYNLGVLDDAAVVSAYQDLGYTVADSLKQLELSKVLRAKSLDSNIAVKNYQAGIASHDEARVYLQGDGVPNAVADSALARADWRAKWDTRKTCLPQLRRRYLQGEWDAKGISAVLLNFGLDTHQIGNLVDRWNCSIAARPKQVSAAQLCKWYTQGLITIQEMAIRLGRMGFASDDIQRILAECQGKALQESQKAKDKAVKLAEAARRAIDRQASVSRRNVAQQLKAAESAAAVWGVSVAEASDAIHDQIVRLMREFKTDIGTARSVVLEVADSVKGTTIDDFPGEVSSAWHAVITDVRGAVVSGTAQTVIK